jgi:hypothetical protein
MLDDVAGAGLKLGARRDSLRDPGNHEQRGRGKTDHVVRRHDPDQKATRGHQEDGQREQPFAADLVAEWGQ